MRNGIASEFPVATPTGMFYLQPNTACAGASLVVAPDWSVFDTDGPERVGEWTEEEIVFLHWRLLQDVQMLADPEASLQEKITTLRWIFTEPAKDAKPFSFASCLRVVGCSPLSPIAYCGAVDCETIREHIAGNAAKWLHETLARYPQWVQQEFARNPEWVDAQLDRNPQWINEQLSKLSVQGDLFA